ncbi:hypothetical protein THRCLA_05919 [Thraustotheca clavata]|uniref:t-SNARE coiled-coil homology domain-containing protein n=1 Tax=Thraustotheca clavata TaxID=74557 RepID=A0A1V9ZRC9_9STRA|nr:hypothetical protein THRCLA_05919 [Thraustotheca clavata]
MQQDATKEVDKDNQFTDSLRLNAETVAISREVATTLSQQSEQLSACEDALDLTQQVVEQANYVVRGMSWSGWLANKFITEPTIHSSHQQSSKEISMGFICPECRVAQKSQQELVQHYENMHLSNSSSDARREPSTTTSSLQSASAMEYTDGLSQEQSQYLAALGPQLLELKNASRAIGNHLDQQLAQLDRITSKSEKTKDDMRLVTAKATKLTSSLMTITPQFRFAFQELSTQKFISNVNGVPMVCKDAASEDCIFRAFTVADSTEMWGFLSEASGLYFGVNAFGSLKIQGAALKSYEHFAIDATREATTLFNFASSLGSGGWVCMNADGSLYCIRRTSTNKSQATLFKLVKI